VQDSALLATMFRTMASYASLHASGAPTNRVSRMDGVVATITPSTPDRSVLNSVLYERREALEQALERLAADYEAAGVRAWTVWVPERDREAATLLEQAGHRVEGKPASMVLMHDHEEDCGFWFAATTPRLAAGGSQAGSFTAPCSTPASAVASPALRRRQRWAGRSTNGSATGTWEAWRCGSGADADLRRKGARNRARGGC
jgi:hypothetical protein